MPAPTSTTRYAVDDLQAAEPEALTTVEGITVTIDDDLDSMGLNRVSVEGPTREAVLDYVRANWGDDEATGGWFTEYVANRVAPVTAARSSDAFLVKVEDAWAYETKGEIVLADDTDPDRPLADLVTRLADYARENIASVATQQVDKDGNDIDTVTDDELARRIAVALDGVLYGGR